MDFTQKERQYIKISLFKEEMPIQTFTHQDKTNVLENPDYIVTYFEKIAHGEITKTKSGLRYILDKLKRHIE